MNVKKLQKFATEVDVTNKTLITYLAALVNRTDEKEIRLDFEEFKEIQGKHFDVSFEEKTAILKFK